MSHKIMVLCKSQWFYLLQKIFTFIYTATAESRLCPIKHYVSVKYCDEYFYSHPSETFPLSPFKEKETSIGFKNLFKMILIFLA